MSSIVLNTVTQMKLDAFCSDPSNFLILTGPIGSGKYSAARYAISKILGIDDSTYPYILRIVPENNTISIETIRTIHAFLQLRVPNARKIDRIILIQDADYMGVEAQNALLKNVEEPPEGTLFIFTVAKSVSLVDTLRSRATEIIMQQPAKVQLRDHFSSFDDPTFERAYLISGGKPGLLTAILTDEDHQLLEATEQARKLLSSTVFERLTYVDELSKKSILATNILEIMQYMARIQMLQNNNQLRKWQSIYIASYEALESIRNKTQPKIVMTNLMLQL